MEAGRGHYVVMESRDEEIRHIIKGKRTKRQRIQSSSSQSEEAFLEDHDNGGSNVFSSSSSLDQIQTSTDEEEEQDMAYSLILLAQGVRLHENTPMISKSPNTHMYSATPATSPISFRATGKMGRSYDYECKTCGRTFHSFQALGGHRASHKKPKTSSAIEGAEKGLQLSFFGGGGAEEEEEEEAGIKNRFSHPLSLSLNPRTQSGNNKANKIHECSICGAEFISGQALGGHMRRHRAPLMAASSSLSLNPPMEDLKPEETQIKRKRFRISLDLDLNLPAQSEDDNDPRESKLMSLINSKQQKKRQQQHESPHVFSSPAVVDCLY